MPPDSSTPSTGYFYVIQLLPEELPSRLKLGWTRTPHRRLMAHRCTCPGARITQTWPCPQIFEGLVLDAVEAAGVRRLGQEVFDTPDVNAVLGAVSSWFEAAKEINVLAVERRDVEWEDGPPLTPKRAGRRRWPQPKRLPSGRWGAQFRLAGERRFVSADTRVEVLKRMRDIDAEYRQEHPWVDEYGR